VKQFCQSFETSSYKCNEFCLKEQCTITLNSVITMRFVTFCACR